MEFRQIELESWERKEYFTHYLDEVVCSYAMTVNMDITNLTGQKLYPAMIWLLTTAVNHREEFRTAMQPEGLGVFDAMHPSYTVLNKEHKNFSALWTEYSTDYPAFFARYQADVLEYGSSRVFSPKPGKPSNTFDISMMPWATFTSFQLNLHNGGRYLLPIFTMGKSFSQGDKTLLPLAIQVHHAVCDGYHVGLFLEDLQERIDRFPKMINYENQQSV